MWGGRWDRREKWGETIATRERETDYRAGESITTLAYNAPLRYNFPTRISPRALTTVEGDARAKDPWPHAREGRDRG